MPKAKYNNKKHDNPRIYQRWHSMMSRCYDSSYKDYKNYGARGIIVEDYLQDFDNFCYWFKEYCEDNSLQMDRIDNNGNYDRCNIRFVSAIENARNTRSNVNFTYMGITLTLSEWVEITGLSRSIVYGRVKHKWPEEYVFSKEKYHRWNPPPFRKTVKQE